VISCHPFSPLSFSEFCFVHVQVGHLQRRVQILVLLRVLARDKDLKTNLSKLTFWMELLVDKLEDYIPKDCFFKIHSEEITLHNQTK
jgi:hypothetical protein